MFVEHLIIVEITLPKQRMFVEHPIIVENEKKITQRMEIIYFISPYGDI